jgi:hypothetical protein
VQIGKEELFNCKSTTLRTPSLENKENETNKQTNLCFVFLFLPALLQLMEVVVG